LGLLAGPFALAGLVRLAQRQPAWAMAGALIVAANGAYTTIYAAENTQPYWLVGLVIVAAWLGVGLHWACQQLALRLDFGLWSKDRNPKSKIQNPKLALVLA